MRKREAKANAIKLDIGDIKYLHEIVDWARDNGVLNKTQYRRANRWVDKPWPKAWSSYACEKRTAEQAWEEARKLTGDAVKAWMKNDRSQIEAELASKEQHPWSDEADFEELMDCDDNRPPEDKFQWEDGLKVVSGSTHRNQQSKSQCTYGKWQEFCALTDTGDWDAVLRHQHNDYYKDGVMVPAKPWLHPYDPHKYIPPSDGPWVQKDVRSKYGFRNRQELD